MSLPMWGEWIEILNTVTNSLVYMSLPMWGEWIEIGKIPFRCRSEYLSLPMWGEWIEMFSLWVFPTAARVSPHVGRVD